MLLRAQFRRVVVEQLRLLCSAADNKVYENRALPTTVDALPVISVSTPYDGKTSQGRGAPKFTSVFHLRIDARVTGETDEMAVKAIETLIEQIELATLANKVIVNLCQQFVMVETQMSVDISGGRPIATATIVLQPEIQQVYDPAMPDRLAEIEVFRDPNETEPGLLKIKLPA